MSYYISSRFLDKLAVHITKNFLDIPGVRVPLILGVHGRKGEGKSFQCELVFEKMGIEAVHISGGELESPDAGDPARLLRLRYREAADLIKVRGKMIALMINDLDAGAGRFDRGTQYTVNTQLVNATLMNIADNPTNVQLPGSYDSSPLNRVPIIVTGNDLSTLYAPLIRDGRMEKFFWEPNREDKIGIVAGIFDKDELSAREIEQFVDTFIDQAIDFFGAVRSRVYDEQIRQFIHEIGFERISSRVVNSAEGKPTFLKPDFRLSRLIEFGNLMVQEQQRVQNSTLVQEYNAGRLNNYQQTPNPAPATPIPNQVANNSTKVETIYKVNYASSNNDRPNGSKLSAETQEQVRQLLAKGYKIGMEHANERRFRTQSWQSCSPIETSEVSDAIAALESCLNEHTGEYVRLIGIDPKVKRRIVETIIQKPKS
ncbi:ribulose bisphosphate carboxylase small subunit [Argonema antarcticum]|uniref:ribulose bisphosphate carboxylase small subunit n=1 Tax=Argonema antarcticum TaxID=2942763 RepID=UPI0020126B8A|nr:ribulose bisphosphate carboxylase small subunit [Argonema antarcticum]MCL1471476.1 ribulose bisphosphate carboxylase small subunit [Argonema antarcticum A004/B2]